jgi:hypothetical protein
VKIILVIVGLLFTLYANEKQGNTIENIALSDGTTLVKVHFNYLNSFKKMQRIRGVDGFYTLDFSLPNKWELLDVNGYIKYTPSVLLLKELSSAIVSVNNEIISQFKIFDYKNSGIKFHIDRSILEEHNKLQFELIQHYTYKCEDVAHSSLWSDLDLQHSYLEFHVRPKAIKELISSIQLNVFDDKQYNVDPINFVMSKKNDDDLKKFALFTSAASTSLKYRLEKIKVSNQLDLQNHNLIIASKKHAKELLSILKKKYIVDEKPSLSLFFNSKSCDAWLNRDDFAKIEADSNVQILKEGAFNHKSLFLNNNQVILKNLKIKKKNAVTVSFWFKPKHIQNFTLFGFNKYSLIVLNNHIGFNSVNKDLYGSEYRFKEDKWYHLSAIFYKNDISKNELFINGKKLLLTQIIGKPLSENVQLSSNAFIGSAIKVKQLPYKGYIDQFYMFDHAITSKSIKKLYKYSTEHKKLSLTESLYLDDKLAHDINIIQNPYNIDKAIIVLAPEQLAKQQDLIYALYKNDLSMYKYQGLDIYNIQIPLKAQAYSAKDFVPLGKKIYFSELGYKTKLLKGQYPPKIKLKFKVYPDNYFDAKDRIKTNIRYVLPSVVRKDSVVNTFINGNFADQLDITKTQEESQISIAANKLFNFNNSADMPVYLIGKGYNELMLDFSLMPIKDDYCSIFNTENLVASVLDDSYFILPKANKWIEMPYMQFITNAQYPYSIYPDLQDSVIYLTNSQDATISSAMNFLFFLTQELGSYPNYLKITTKLSNEDKKKNIIIFGSIYDDKIQEFSKDAPIVFEKNKMKKVYPYIKRFVENKSIINEDRLKKYKFKISMQETNFIDRNIIMQMFQSQFNKNKTILMFTAGSATCLNKGVSSILQYKNRNFILGDTVIYDFKEEKGLAYNIKDKYIVSNLSWIKTLSLEIGVNPLRYIIAFIILLSIFVWIVKSLLAQFKKEHHKDAE